MAVKKSYGSIEEQEIDEEPVASADEDLPDPEDHGDIDKDTKRRLEAAQTVARRRRGKAEREESEPADDGSG